MSDGEASCMQKLSKGVTCPRVAVYKYTWPGEEERIVCEHHSHKLQDVARALSFRITLTVLP